MHGKHNYVPNAITLLYQQVCGAVCGRTVMGALPLLVEWAHNPEDTGSDPRAGV